MDDSVSTRPTQANKPTARPAARTKVGPKDIIGQTGQTGRRLDQWKNSISAKEKTGVDPLSQVTRPMADSDGVSLRETMLPNLTPEASSSISGRSWTDHRNVPTTSKSSLQLEKRAYFGTRRRPGRNAQSSLSHLLQIINL